MDCHSHNPGKKCPPGMPSLTHFFVVRCVLSIISLNAFGWWKFSDAPVAHSSAKTASRPTSCHSKPYDTWQLRKHEALGDRDSVDFWTRLVHFLHPLSQQPWAFVGRFFDNFLPSEVRRSLQKGTYTHTPPVRAILVLHLQPAI